MEPKTYPYQLPERANLLIVTCIPFLTSLYNYYFQDSGSQNEMITMFSVCSFLFAIAMFFVRRWYMLKIDRDSFETIRRKYRPEDIRVLKLYRRYGWVTIKVNGYISSRTIRFHKSIRSVAIDEMINWATRNDVIYRVYK
jgi:hypothetical protein